MPRVSGRATVATRPPFWNYFHPRLLTSRSQRLLNPVFRPITCSKRKGFFLLCFCSLSVFYNYNCPCGKENRWFGEKKETEKPLKNRHHYWHASLPIFVSHSRCDWISHNYDIAQTYSMFYRHRSVLTLPALSKLVLRNWFLRKIPQKGHLYRDKWETSSENVIRTSLTVSLN